MVAAPVEDASSPRARCGCASTTAARTTTTSSCTSSDGTPHIVSLRPAEAGTISVRLAPGTYTLVCNLFAGTPDSHEAKGMKTTLTVR